MRTTVILIFISCVIRTGLVFAQESSPKSEGFTISGHVFEDLNGDGDENGLEDALSGWTLYLDRNDNGEMDPGEPASSSDDEGFYMFINLAPGSYTVREVIPAGWTTTSKNLAAVTASKQNVNFGNRRENSSIGHAGTTGNSSSAGQPDSAYRYGSVSGRLLNASHDDLATAVISIPELGIATMANSFGGYLLQAVEPGEWAIVVLRYQKDPLKKTARVKSRETTLGVDFSLGTVTQPGAAK